MTGQKPRILIVEDDPIVTKMLQHMLEDIGQIRSATDVYSALQLLQEFDPDLVMVDLVIPRSDVSGTDLIRMLRADAHTCDKPILVVSAASIDALSAAHEAGADLIIRKPFKLQWLRSDVENLLSRVAS